MSCSADEDRSLGDANQDHRALSGQGCFDTGALELSGQLVSDLGECGLHALAEWVKGFGKRITGVYVTHGHQDHWVGLARLQEHFPDAGGIATEEVAGRARFEIEDPGVSTYWKTIFAGELPEVPVLPEVLPESEFTLEGRVLRAVSVGQGDTAYSTVLHVPSAAAVAGGNVVYNGVHMMTAETDDVCREDWIASLDKVAGLEPRIVIAGHKSFGASDDRRALPPLSNTCVTSPGSCTSRRRRRTSSLRCWSCTVTVITPGFSGTPPARLSRSAADRIET